MTILIAAAAFWKFGGASFVSILGGLLLFCILPGFGFTRLLLGTASRGRLESLALAPAAYLSVASVACLVAHFVEVAPRWPLLATTGAGLVAHLAAESRRGPGSIAYTLRVEAGVALSCVLLFGLMWFSPEQRSLSSDVYAHVAAMRATIDEGRVFPLHEFYPPEQGTGADPRFGTLHPIYAQLADWVGLDPLRGWHLAAGLGIVIFACGAWVLSRALFDSISLALLATLLALCGYGGSYYNLFRIAAFPLWVGMGVLFAAMGLWWQSEESPRGLRTLAILLLVALPLIHALAGIFAVITVGCALLVRWRGVRASAPALSALAGLGLVLLLRFGIAYGDVNPIHHRPWELMRWPGLGFSAKPTYLFAWLAPLGLATLFLLPSKWRVWWSEPPMRWLMLLALGGIGVAALPPVLKLLMPVLGFLPLRFVMLLFFPWLLTRWLARWVDRPRILGLLIAAALVATTFRFGGRWQDRANADLTQSAEFQGLVTTLAPRDAVESPTILSDPFTMLALRASIRCAIVAVPDGRSSPRDGNAVPRLRDSWAALSPYAGEGSLRVVLQRYGVSHVVWNGAFEQDLHGYEYPVLVEQLPAMRERLDAMTSLLEPVLSEPRFAVYRVRTDPGPYEAGQDFACPLQMAESAGTRHELASGFYLRDARAHLRRDDGSGPLLSIRGRLGYSGEAEVPDRRLIVRADRIPSPEPTWLRVLQKPTRKLLEKLRGERYRGRWDALPNGGHCPSWVLEPGMELPLDLDLAWPSDLAPGRYRVTVQAADFSVFTVEAPTDYFLNEDSYSGPQIAIVDHASRGLEVQP